MKKIIVVTIVALSFFSGKAQESASKLKLHAANAGFGLFAVQKQGTDNIPACVLLDATFSINKNLISVSYIGGWELSVLANSPQYTFNEFSLLYGREFKAANWFRLEGFAGAGLYSQNRAPSNPNIDNHDNTISIPLRLNAKFYFSKKFGIGFCSNYSINKLTNNFTENLIFHYRFN